MSYSIYIPRVFKNIDEEKIKQIFDSANIGIVSRVDFIEKTNNYGEKYNMVFVWFSQWFNNKAAINLKEKIDDPNSQAKFVYEDPWFWILLPNTSKGDDKEKDVEQECCDAPQQMQYPVPQQMQYPVPQQMQYPAPQQMQYMMYLQPGYYPQWNMHVPPLYEAPYGYGIMEPYTGDDAMMDEIEDMMEREVVANAQTV